MFNKKMLYVSAVFSCIFIVTPVAQAAFDLSAWQTQAQATAGNVVADNTGWTFDGTNAINYNYGNLDTDSDPQSVDQGASIEYIFNLTDNGPAPALGSLDGITSEKTTFKLEQWQDKGVFGVSNEGVVDAIFRRVNSVFGTDVHVVFVNRTDGDFEIFIDGVSVKRDNYNGDWVTNGGPGKLGGDSTGWGAPNGTIYAVGSYDRALNATEVAALYDAAHSEVSGPEFTGRIAYHSYSNYTAMDSVIRVCDLQDQSPFTINAINQNTKSAMNASFSPDGSMLVFMGDPPGASSAWWNMEVYVYDFTTNSLLQLTDNAFPSEDPKFSPDGSKIVYKRYNEGPGYSTIHTMDLDGTNITALTETSGISHDESGPNYSPDGSKIAYWRTWNDGDVQERIWRMNSTGSSAQQLVPNSNVRIMYYPVYLDSQRIAYTRWLSDQSELDQIYICSASGSGSAAAAFSNGTANDSDAFSMQDPDWMGFSSTRTGSDYDLYFGDPVAGAVSSLSYANTSNEDLGGSYTPIVDPPTTRTVTVDSDPQGAGFTISGAGGNTFLYSGTTPWTNAQMLPGNYTVDWDPVPSYITPASETDYLTSGSVSFFETYVPDSACTPTDMHIEAVVCGEVGCGQGKNNGQVTVTIYDDCGNPVANALVDATFSGDINETIVDVATDGNGVAVLTSSACVRRPSFSVTVDSVTHGTLPHDSNDDLATGCSG